MNTQQFVKFLNDCNKSLSDEFEIKYKFVYTIATSKDESSYFFNLLIVSKLNNVTSDFCHFTIKDDSANEVVAQAIAYLQCNDEVPCRVHEVVNAYIAGFICAGGLL